MKKAVITLSLLACVGGIMSLQSCDKIKNEVKKKANVDLEYNLTSASAAFTIPVMTTTGNTTLVDTIPVPFNVNKEIQDATAGFYTIDDVESITILTAKAKINNPSTTNNFANFSAGIAYFYTDTKAEAAFIATNDQIPDTYDDEIELVPTTENLAAYLRGTTVYYVAGFNARRVTTQDLNCTLSITYHVKLKEKN